MLDEKEYYGALDPEIQKQAKQYARIHRWGSESQRRAIGKFEFDK